MGQLSVIAWQLRQRAATLDEPTDVRGADYDLRRFTGAELQQHLATLSA